MKKIYLLLFIVLSTFIFSHNVYAAEGDRVYIQISEDGEIVSATHFDINDIDVYDVDNYYNYDGDVLTFTNSAFYIVESGYYDLEVNQDYDGPIGLRLFNDGDLLLDGLNVEDGYYITANGEMTIKNSKIKLIGYDNDSLGQINTQDDLIIDNSEVKCINGSDDRTGLGHIHSYWGDIYIKNKSKVRVDDRLYTDDCSIYIDDSFVNLENPWGYMYAPENIKINKSIVSFVFGIEAGEKLEIVDSEVDAIDEESMYAFHGTSYHDGDDTDNHQGWIQVSDGELTIKNSDINVINSITSALNMTVDNSDIVINGAYTNNGYLQSGEGSITINNSHVKTDKDVYAYENLTIKDSEVIVSGLKSHKGYLEASFGILDIRNSTIEVDEGIVADKDSSFVDSDIKVNGTNSNRGYIEVHDGSLNVSGTKINTKEKMVVMNKTVFNNSKINLKSGIISNGIDIINSSFYAANNSSLNDELSTTSPVISLGKLLIKNSDFVAESVNEVPSIASLGEIEVVDNGFINKNNNYLEVIVVDANEDNFVKGVNGEFINVGDKVYTTALNGEISSFSTLKLKIVNPETVNSFIKALVFLIIIVGAAIFVKFKKNKVQE